MAAKTKKNVPKIPKLEKPEQLVLVPELPAVFESLLHLPKIRLRPLKGAK